VINPENARLLQGLLLGFLTKHERIHGE